MNRKLFRFVLIAVALGILAFVTDIVGENNAEVERNSKYTFHIKVGAKKEMREAYIVDFLEKCRSGKTDEAYEMLDQKSKEEFKTKENFSKFATKKLFNNDIAAKSYSIQSLREKEAITQDYTEVEYLVSFRIIEKEKFDKYKGDKSEYREYLIHQIRLIDYSPNNYKISISIEKKYEE